MFEIGDKVFYPMHGAGVIEAIEKREILGETHKYCLFTIFGSNMDVMIPLKNMEKTGIRQVVNKETVREILHEFHTEESTCKLAWKARFKQNTDKLKTGKMEDAAEVVRDLLHREMESALNASEKQMLNNARKMLISELSIIKNISEDQAAEMLILSH
ncbi:CarD family transcriptional regulator [Bacillus sp. FJAT-50079]|uniref:CarD family transcriptional regulator n=1 Tax=Bacillus sp. FJAT-50079 TaxID=2833577 RepID=UPI001BC9E581|nr:CarD family transcriptional regulator [Bacillus sp. FJAT-50079]MBS4208459.1 transcription factor YdeB [Bacillus sp. FJAT-50079]